ncbi:p-loop containing nucleoside triphosphate hydrolase protein [Mycena sanguinolenta]|uniref:p-loop containing nucleoside triphosphate hydrolase protein n=1 Tax=Mycena sanguinolenta TaxID=230812 RepID=A0A8H6YXZ5_9AGAR|nr:p-loop containing nucleoside triphosphate hydrolase protein [Mycena sanguinolenta]
MGGVFSDLSRIVTAILGSLSNIRDQPAGSNPTHDDIEAADRLARAAEMSVERALEAEAAKEAAQAEAERIRREAEESRLAAERAAEAERHEAQRREQEIREQARREAEEARDAAERAADAERREAQRREQEIKEAARREAEEARAAAERAAEAERREAQRREEGIKEAARREAEEARAAAEQAAGAERREVQKREQEIREEARRAVEAAQQEALRQQQLTENETRRAAEAKLAAEEAERIAADEVRAAHEAKAELEHQLREGIQPVVMPSSAELEDAKRRMQYQDGLYHFAVAGIAGGGKSSLINALRGLRNKDAGAAPTGITETTLSVGRFPDSDPENPFVWYDIPGAGTLQVPEWQYFNKQGLYVFDALIVLIDNRFTATDVAILRNARLFNIPCYIVRSKADSHIRNLMRHEGYESDDEQQDARSRAALEAQARKKLVSETRKSVQDNLRAADLPEQRVYIVSNSTMLSACRGSVTTKTAKKIIDELEFLQDLLGDADKRRGSGAKERGSPTAVVKPAGTGGKLPQILGYNFTAYLPSALMGRRT